MVSRTICIIVALLLGEMAFGQGTAGNRPAMPFAFGPGQREISIPLAKGWDALFVNVKINDKDAGYFLIDTRSARSSVDRDHALQLGLEVQGRSDLGFMRAQKIAGIATAKTLAFGPAVIANMPIWVREAPLVFHGVKIGGVLGIDAFGQGPVTIDFRAGVLKLYDPEKFEQAPGNATTYELQLGMYVPLMRVSVQGNFGQKNTGWFELDSTDLNELSLGHSFMSIDRSSGHGGIAISGGGLLGPNLGVLPGALSLKAEEGRAAPETNNLYISFYQSLEAPGWITSPAQRVYRLDADLAETSAGAVGLGMMQKMRLSFDLWTHRMWVQWMDKEPLDAMLQRLGDPKQADVVGATPLLMAALARRPDAVQTLLQRHADPNVADALGITPLMAAAQRGDGISVTALLGAEAQVDARSQTDAFTPLLCAAQGGDITSLMSLLKAGASIEGTSQSGRTALYLAAEGRFRQAVQLLLDRGAEVDHALPNRQTPLVAACGNDNADCAQILLEHHANPNASAQRGTPLTLACEAGSASCVRLLLQYKARVDQMDDSGRIPLAVAAGCYGGAECVKLLLDSGAQKSQTGRDGKTAYDWAIKSGSPQTLRLLSN